MTRTAFAAALAATLTVPALAQTPPPAAAPAAVPDSPRIAALKAEAIAGVVARAKQAQVINDMVFSFAELGEQEIETSKYLTGILEKAGFTIVRGVGGLPTGWTAKWTNPGTGGSAGPVIALGSDIDCIPKASQKPGIPTRDPIVAGAPGHGEGHNSGQALNIVAALALKDLMTKEKIPGTLMLWPGIAEEALAGKAYMVRDGVFKGVDATIFTHVDDNFVVEWGPPEGTGLVSVKYHFHGEAAHAAGAPWLGKSALDAVELMDIGWNFRREHLKPEQRSHYVITDGGDQPNVVPSEASVWYYFREQSFAGIAKNFAIGNRMADAAAMMTDTRVDREIVGTAAPGYLNKPMAEAAAANMAVVGLPAWDAADQALAHAVQKSLGSEKQDGMPTKIDGIHPPKEKPDSGGSDDIGDISWQMPTITIRYPANIPGLPGHHWSNAIAMATPIAHKGVVAGAKVAAMTMVDLLAKPELLTAAKAWFKDVQTKDQHYVPVLTATDKPPITLNADKMAKFRPEMTKFYYDPAKYPTYLDQLGIKWPSVPLGK